MGLAARLSTSANRQDDDNEYGCDMESVFGNICLVQFQAIASGLLVGFVSCILGRLAHGAFNAPGELLLILAASTTTAFLSSLLTSGLLAFIIVRSRDAHVNPDNVSTPLANCLGDLSAMAVLAGVSRVLFALNSIIVNAALLLVSVMLGMFWASLTWRHFPSVRPLLWSGWPPVLIAITISSFAGLAFERFVRYFEGLGMILTVANGICGNAASIIAARISTSLQLESRTGDHRVRSATLTIMLLCAPLHGIFLAFLSLTGLGHTSISLTYVVGHLFAGHTQFAIMIALVPGLTRRIWKRGLDPDSYVLPILGSSPLLHCFGHWVTMTRMLGLR